MNSSLLNPNPPSFLASPTSPFINPIPIRVTTIRQQFCYKPRIRSRYIRCSASTSTDQKTVSPDVFGEKKELSGFQSVVDAMSPPVRLASSVIVFAGAVAAGYGLGFKFGGSRSVGLGGAVALGAAGAGAAYALNSSVPELAAINLHNYVAECDDPEAVSKEDIESIANKYGVSKQNETFNAELCDIYSRYVSAVIPSGNEELKGHEADAIIKFKSALGLDDPDAAAMHMEIGRRLYRLRLETGDREGDMEQRRAFQKLIYVSNIVFGEASTFLLPWKRIFKVSDAQVAVAVRDNAQRLYLSKLKSLGRDLDTQQLIRLREAQLLYRLSDELAEDSFREHVRKLAEEKISSALTTLKSRTRTAKEAASVIEDLDNTVAFNNLLISLKNHPDATRFARGLGPVSLFGGEYDADKNINDLKLLYRAYLTDALSAGRLEENKIAALSQLKNIFGLGNREADSITVEITSKVYRKRLSQSVSSGLLEAADSKAAFLQDLCEELHFDPLKATEMHQEIYRQKLQQCVTKGELSEKDVKSLERLQILLCIPKQTVDAVHADICGKLFEKIVGDAIYGGVDGYTPDVKLAVRKAAYSLRLSREIAMSIASKAVRKVFISYVKKSRSAQNKQDAAKALKNMILFNNVVVEKLIADVKGEDEKDSESSISTPIVEVVTDSDSDSESSESESDIWKNLESLQKLRIVAAAGTGQTEITLKDDLPERDRIDLYKTYLLFCITGASQEIKSFSIAMKIEKDDSEYINLSKLGNILGLTHKEILSVHTGLAEESYRKQAEVVLADGQLTKKRMEQLTELMKESGLPEVIGNDIIKSITSTKLASALESAVGQGRIGIKEVRELKESGIELEIMLSTRLRESLYKKTIDAIFSSGKGEFNDTEVYERIPSDLSIDPKKAGGVVRELARARLSSSLIQAVSLLRQRKHDGVVSSLNDLLACDKAVPAQPLSWDVPEELADLYLVYMKQDPEPEKLSRLQYLLNIEDSTAEALKGMRDRAMPNPEEEEEFVF